MQIHYKTFTLGLEMLPLDIGYASEKVKMVDTNHQSHIVGGQNGKTQLFISLPFIDESTTQELQNLSMMMSQNLSDDEKNSLEVIVVVANDSYQNPNIEGFKFLIDYKGEFGDWYGVRIAGEVLQGEFAKAVIVVSKDGALFYDQFATNIETPLNYETLLRKIAAAHACYTGKGCH